MEAREEQPLNALFPMLVADGRFTAVSEMQLPKALYPILVAEGRVTEARKQLPNALSPTLTTEGRLMEASEPQFINALSSTLFTVAGAVKPWKLLP